MARRAFFIAGDRIVHIANPAGAGLSYQALQHEIRPGAQVGPHREEHAETVILVERGAVTVMINGLDAPVVAGSYVRIPAKTWFAYRNESRAPAIVLCRTAPVPPAREACRITMQIAAA